MARISPAAPEQFAQVADEMQRWQATKGYPPNSWLTMVRKPRVFSAYRNLHTAVMMDDGEVPRPLKFMVACIVSSAAGDESPVRATRLTVHGRDPALSPLRAIATIICAARFLISHHKGMS